MKYIRKILLLAIVAGLIIGGVLIVKYNNQKSNKSGSQSQPTSSASSSQTSNITDTNGQTSSPSPSPAKSSSGVITLDQPSTGAKLSTGTTVSGEASVNPVYYRLKDNIKGVIGQGSLNVVNGKFSGQLSVNSKDTSGTFEVYSINPASYTEENNIKINVTF